MVMTIETFVFLLSFFSVVTSLITEAIKKVTNIYPNIIATVVALIVGCGGMFTYYFLNNISINATFIVYAVLMGLASALSAMVGYDKVKETVLNLNK